MEYAWSAQSVIAAAGQFETFTVAQRASESLQSSPLMAGLYILLSLVGVGGLVAVLGMGLIYAERKVAGHFQCRLGPMRVGPHGILQTLADTFKLLLKEDIVPAQADKVLHVGAVLISICATVLLLGMLPYSSRLHIADLNIGVLYLTAVGGLGVMGTLLGGWSSNNKWSLIGGMRAAAQVISYEISATLSVLVVVIFAGTLSLAGIVESQEAGWWIWRAHVPGVIAFIMFIIASTAELNRTPFDIPEGESELTAGFHTEYSGLRFAMFFLAEFVNMFIASGIGATLFLGGWMPFFIPGLDGFNHVMAMIPGAIWFFCKAAVLVFVFMWFRWTFPRLRVDQLMDLEWKVLLPVGFVNLVIAAIVVVSGMYFFPR